MAVIDALPPGDVILSLKGVLDYYVQRGQVCVRTWPRKPRMPRSTAVQAVDASFGAYSRDLTLLAALLRNAAIDATTETLWTWKDATTAGAYGSLNVLI